MHAVVARLNVTESDCGDETSESDGSSVRDIDAGREGDARTNFNVRDLKNLEAPDEQSRVERYAVRTGNTLVDQFEPWYYGIAFGFLFKHCIGMPDPPSFMNKSRYRRDCNEPRVPLERWVRIMARRV